MIINWIKNFVNKLVNRKENEVIKLPDVENNEKKAIINDFNIKLRVSADKEIDDKSGYRIGKVIDLKDMV